MTADPEALREDVRARYAEAARAVSTGEKQGCGSGSCCATDHDTAKFGEALYDADQRAGLPENAATASLGCGNPTAVAELREGETVLDLGSGGGIDALLSARRVGPTGVVYGLDMTEEMLALAQRNKAEAGATNVHFLARRDREHPVAGRDRRRRDLELRHQPLDRQESGPARDRPRAQAGRPGRRQRCRRRGPALTRGAGRAGRLGGLHRGSSLRVGVRDRPRGGRRSRRSRWPSHTRSPTACTGRSCGRSGPSPGTASYRSSAPRRATPAVRSPAAASERR